MRNGKQTVRTGRCSARDCCFHARRGGFERSREHNPVAESLNGPRVTTQIDVGSSTGASLTVGGERNNLASNIALGRDAAGVHYRSDRVEGIKVGEAIAISILRDTATLYNEVFPGFSFTKYDETPVTISPGY